MILLAALSLAGAAGAMEVTVYNQNLGLVRETRELTLKAGIGELRLTDVPSQIDATSVHFKSLTSPGDVTVLEQDFQYDLVSQAKLLDKYLGKEIELERFTGVGGDKREVISGKLLSNAGRILLSDGKVLVDPPGNPVLPELPEGLLTRPTLVWQLQSGRGGKQKCELSYLTAGMGWHADYVLVASPNDDRMDMNAWVTIDNNSGATYKDAKLKLVAGDVHRAQPQYEPMRMKSMAYAGAAAAQQFAEKSFFEYHLYTLQRPTTLAENETKQLELASASDVPIQKRYIFDGAPGYFFGGGAWNLNPAYGADASGKVHVLFEFLNSKKNNLGMALPKGRVRVYKKDDDGSLEFIGEDQIDHTPKDEKLKIQMGEAFDVVGERKRANFESHADRKRAEESFEIKLRNHKDSDVTVTVVEHLYRWSGWEISDSSRKWTKKDAQTIEFEVPVPKDGEAVVTYKVLYRW